MANNKDGSLTISNTEKVYTSYLKTWLSLVMKDDDERSHRWMKKHPTISCDILLKSDKKYNVKTLKNFLTAMLWSFKEKDGEIPEAYHKFYNKYLLLHKQLRLKIMMGGIIDSNGTEDSNEGEEIAFEDLKAKCKELALYEYGSRRHLLLAMITYLSDSLRHEWHEIMILRKSPGKGKEPKTNYMVINTRVQKLILHQSEKYESVIMNIPKELVRVIEKSLECCPRDILFTDLEGNKFSITSFTYFCNKTLKDVLGKDGVCMNKVKEMYMESLEDEADLQQGYEVHDKASDNGNGSKRKVQLVIVRGAAGSGKTTYAKDMYPNHKYVASDEFFTKDDGTYEYDPRKAKLGNEWCMNKTKMMLERGEDTIVCNTFTSRSDVSKYVIMAKRLGIQDIKIIRLTTLFKSEHKVPGMKVEDMIVTLAKNKIQDEEVIHGSPSCTSYKYILTNQELIAHNSLSHDEKSKWISFDDQNKIRDMYLHPKRNDSLKDHMKYLASYVFTKMEPLRDEWCHMRVITQNNKSYKYGSYMTLLEGECKVYLCEDEEWNPSLILEYNTDHLETFLKSIASFPRKYIFCDLEDESKPMTRSGFLSLLETMYQPHTEKKVDIVILRRAYVNGCVNFECMSNKELEDVCKHMRVYSCETLMSYRVLGMSSDVMVHEED